MPSLEETIELLRREESSKKPAFASPITSSAAAVSMVRDGLSDL